MFMECKFNAQAKSTLNDVIRQLMSSITALLYTSCPALHYDPASVVIQDSLRINKSRFMSDDMGSSNESSKQSSVNHPHRSSTESDNSMMSIEGSISELVGSSVDDVKQRLLAASASMQGAWSHLRSKVTGTNDDRHNQDKPDKEEMRRINSMEKEQVAEFLRHKYRSDAHSRLKRP